jgi:RHS repeat-associated protein
MRIFFKILLLVFTVGDVYSSTAVATLRESQRWLFASINSYNASNRALWMVDTIGSNACRLDIAYGPDGQRSKTVLKQNGNITKTVIFAGNYERVTRSDTVTHLYYISGGEGLCGIYVKQFKGNTALKDAVYYVHPDHLGSLAIITDANGVVKQKCTFDAWGRRQFTVKDNSLIFDRGFTGHEHLDEFSLINMNGRMYDPMLGRFLSPDPYVQDPLLSQSYNRYSYCLNNPLIFTDPDGELFWFAIAIGAIIGGYSGYKIGKAHGATGWGMAGYIFGGAVIGGVAGQVGASIYATALGTIGAATTLPVGFTAGFNAGMISGMAAGAINGAGMALLGGGSFSDVMAGMTMGAWVGGVLGGISGGITEGLYARQWQRNWNNSTFDRSVAMTDNPGWAIDAGNDTYEASIREVIINGRIPLHKTAIAQSIYGAQSSFWNAAPTRAVTTVLTSMIGGGLISGYKWAYSAIKGVRAANTTTNGMGMSGLKTYGSLTEKFGSSYESIAVAQGKHLSIQLGQKLNLMQPGSWSKIYEAGILNGSKVETHYFFNATTGRYVNPFIKSSGWGRLFRGITGY